MNIVSGSVSGMAGILVGQPLDLLKVRMLTSHFERPNMV